MVLVQKKDLKGSSVVSITVEPCPDMYAVVLSLCGTALGSRRKRPPRSAAHVGAAALGFVEHYASADRAADLLRNPHSKYATNVWQELAGATLAHVYETNRGSRSTTGLVSLARLACVLCPAGKTAA